MNDIVIFEADAQQVEVQLEGDTLWLSLQQLADLFGRDKSVVSSHLKNIFDADELQRVAVVAKNATTSTHGKTCQLEFFNLDAIISVGYRVNSSQSTGVPRENTYSWPIQNLSFGRHKSYSWLP